MWSHVYAYKSSIAGANDIFGCLFNMLKFVSIKKFQKSTYHQHWMIFLPLPLWPSLCQQAVIEIHTEYIHVNERTCKILVHVKNNSTHSNGDDA